MTLQEKIDHIIELLQEVQAELDARGGQTPIQADDAGGSNPPGPGQPGKP